MKRIDLTEDFAKTLSYLSEVSWNVRKLEEIYYWRLQHGVRTYVAYTDKVIGTASLLIEYKFIHSSYAGRIEDVVVDKHHQGKGIGKALINHAVQEAKKLGCYKVILNCFLHNKLFYQKCGFKEQDIGMRIDL